MGGEPREPDDRRILEDKLRLKGDFIKLHEIWLSDDYRGMGYGLKSFMYFENTVKEKSYHAIAYYAEHLAALRRCMRRGYKYSHGLELNGITGERSRYYVLVKEQ